MMQGMFPMEILQTPGQITIIQEAYNQVRRVQMGRMHTTVGELQTTEEHYIQQLGERA